MKAQRYKFDELWKEAIRLRSYLSDEYTVQLIRDYIEKGRNVDGEFSQTNFECAWILIKAQIDARKRRNGREREKRRVRRESIMAEKARLQAIEDARRAEAEARRVAQEEAERAARRERNRMKRERHVDRTNCISRGMAKAAPRGGEVKAGCVAAFSEGNGSRMRFTDRFRGPGLFRDGCGDASGGAEAPRRDKQAVDETAQRAQSKSITCETRRASGRG